MLSPRDARNSVLQLQKYLLQLLSDELGTFAVTGQPAIWTEPPYIDEPLKISGIAVIICRYEMMRSQEACVSAPQAIQRFDWKVVLRSYDKSTTGMALLDTAVNKMRQSFAQMRERFLEPVEDTYPQVSFLLDTSRVINLLPR